MISYPYLVSINTVLPALIAGNSVILKPSPQTPLTAERFASALIQAGLPAGTIHVVHASPELTSSMVKSDKVDFVSFTGSVRVGKEVAKDSSSGRGEDGFKGVALEVSRHFIFFCNFFVTSQINFTN